jgi:flagellar protein FlbD
VISLTRLSGTTFLLNADLVERVDCTPDTVVTLVDGTKYLVSESLDDVLRAVVDYRSSIVARAALPEALATPSVRKAPVRPVRLSAVPLAERKNEDRYVDGRPTADRATADRAGLTHDRQPHDHHGGMS